MSIMHGIEYVGYVDTWTDEERLTDEEVVRCRDCRYFGRIDSYHWCENDCIYRPQDDDFCSSGERRDA